MDFPDLTGTQALESCCDFLNVLKQKRPFVFADCDDGYSTSSHVLLEGHTLVRGKQQIVPCFLGYLEERTIPQSFPSSLPSGIYLMPRKMASQGAWRAVVKQYAHA